MDKIKQFTTGWAFLLSVLAVLLSGEPLAAQSVSAELADAMDGFATDIERFLKEKGQSSIAMGQFTPPAQYAASGGPAIAAALSESLEKKRITIKRLSDYSVEGKYRIVDLVERKGKRGHAAISIDGQILNSAGDVVKKLKQKTSENRNSEYLEGKSTLASLVGTTVQISPTLTEEEAAQEFEQRVEDPKAFVEGSHVLADPSSPYRIEVLVSENGKYVPRTPSVEGGLAFIPIQRNEVYAVRITNNSPYDAAVTLTIDGINIFHFSEHKNDYSHVIIAGNKQGTVKGWHRTNEKSDAFQVMEYSKSQAAEVMANDVAVGTITAVFKVAWATDQRPPASERTAIASSKAGDATGRGPEIDAKYNLVSRHVGDFRASISVRYTKRE